MSSATFDQTLAQRPSSRLRLPSLSGWLERLPLAVLALSVTFLQGYALRFWGTLLGSSGWGVSLGLELLHLWFWYRAARADQRRERLGWVVLAALATVLLLASALHEIMQPLLSQAARIHKANQERLALEAEAGELRANLSAFREMAAAQERRGWQEDIRRDTARLQRVSDQLRDLAALSAQVASRPWITQVMQFGVVAVAVLFQLGAVLALWSLTAGSRKTAGPFRAEPAPAPARETVPARLSERAETFRPVTKQPERAFYARLWQAIEAHARRNGARLARDSGRIPQAALAKDLGINPPDLSAIKLLALGQTVPRNPARDAVERLTKRLGLETAH